jgi:LysR family transcriptional activator of nhaA
MTNLLEWVLDGIIDARSVSRKQCYSERRFGFSDVPTTRPLPTMLNYRHLHYFWVVAKEGGFARAAERLNMAIQTISAQVREL